MLKSQYIDLAGAKSEALVNIHLIVYNYSSKRVMLNDHVNENGKKINRYN